MVVNKGKMAPCNCLGHYTPCPLFLLCPLRKLLQDLEENVVWSSKNCGELDFEFSGSSVNLATFLLRTFLEVS